MIDTTQITREFYTPDEVATIMGVNKTTVLRHAKMGCIPAVRLGSRTRIPASYIEGIRRCGLDSNLLNGRQGKDVARQ